MNERAGVLLVYHGTVRSLDELPAYLTRIRGGRPPSEELLDAMRRRYEAIGHSPLAELTALQAEALARQLGLPVFLGTRFASPSLREALAASHGLGRLVILPLAPFSVSLYCRAVAEAWTEGDPELVPVGAWGTHPGLVDLHAEQIRSVLGTLPDPAIMLTAHSLPAQVVRAGDRYPLEVGACASAIGERVGRSCLLAYQSGGPGGDWLGPSVAEVLATVKAAGHRSVIVAPIGFLAEHLETLYDLDVEARAQAVSLGLDWHRLGAPNAAPRLIQTLAEIARQALAHSAKSGASIRPG